MANLKVQLSVQIPSGPNFQSVRTVAVENYETFNLSIPPNKDGTASAGIDRMPKSSEGSIKLLLIQSNIYPTGGDAGEIKLTVENTPIQDQPLHEPLFLLGTEVIKSLREEESSEISLISFVNTYKTTQPTNQDEVEDAEVEKEIVDHTAQLSILIGRAAPSLEAPGPENGDPDAGEPSSDDPGAGA